MDEKITENPSVIMPMIAMRGIVLFPKVVLHFDVGRKKSIAALNDAMKKDQLVFLSAQKDIKDEDLKPGQMYDVGVVAEVRQVIKTGSDVMRILVEGKYRARLIEMVSEEPYFEAKIQEYPLHSLRPRKSILCDALMNGWSPPGWKVVRNEVMPDGRVALACERGS